MKNHEKKYVFLYLICHCYIFMSFTIDNYLSKYYERKAQQQSKIAEGKKKVTSTTFVELLICVS